MNIAERLRYWAQNEEMVDQYYTAHGSDCNLAADCINDLLAVLEYMRTHTITGEERRKLCIAAIARAKEST